MWARIGPLLRKELRQVRRSRGVLFSTTLLPLLLLVVLPALQLYSVESAVTEQTFRTVSRNGGGFEVLYDHKLLVVRFLFPLFLMLGGMLVPSVATTYTIVGERERRSLELLIALPLRVTDILIAKLLAILLLTGAVVLPMFALDAAALAWLHYVGPVDVLELLAVLLAAVAYAVGEALLLALLARDLRTAQNLNGALLVPITALGGALLVLMPPASSLLTASALLLAGTGVCVWIAMKWLSFERYLV